MQIVEVTNSSLEKHFLDVNAKMQQGNVNYIRPIDNEVKEVFNPSANKSFKYGEAKRWLLIKNGEYIGRIAAFLSTKYITKGTDYTTGGIGFFDCINNQSAANMLFDVAKDWLQQKGAEAMDGLINFGDRDKWWGVMLEGFEKPPMYGMSYNPPYYKDLLEGYGFNNYYNQYYYSMVIDDPFPEKIQARHEKFKSKPEYTARHVSLDTIDKYAKDFATVYNAAWAQHGEAKEISESDVLKLFIKLKPILDPRLVWFAYYKEEPIAMFINIPDLNEYFKNFNGRLGLLEKIRLLWMKKTGYCKKATGLAFGVVPKFQALGVDSFIIKECGLLIQGKGWYNEYEMGWAGEWNPKMLNIYKGLGKQSRVMATYRYIFNEQLHPFERHPIMEYK